MKPSKKIAGFSKVSLHCEVERLLPLTFSTALHQCCEQVVPSGRQCQEKRKSAAAADCVFFKKSADTDCVPVEVCCAADVSSFDKEVVWSLNK